MIVYCETHMKHINTPYAQNVQLSTVKAGDTYTTIQQR
jgi:hypothetical protein